MAKFKAFDHIMQKHDIEKIKTIGDDYMKVGGITTSNKTHANDVVHAAMAIHNYMHHHKLKKQSERKLFLKT